VFPPMFPPNLVHERIALTGKLPFPHMLGDYLIKILSVMFSSKNNVTIRYYYILNNDSMVFLFGIYYLGINTLKTVHVENKILSFLAFEILIMFLE
jgi:hypothetical protein